MEIIKFGLGIRFDLYKTGKADGKANHLAKNLILCKLFDVLTAKDVSGLELYAGEYKFDLSECDGVFTVVLAEGRHTHMESIYNKIAHSAELLPFLTAYHPFIQTNLLRKAEGFIHYGKFNKEGRLTDGETEQDFQPVLKAEKSNETQAEAEQNMKIIFAPDKFKGSMSAERIVDLLAEAANEIIPNAVIIRLPIADGGEGTVNAIVRACNGKKRFANVTAPMGGKKVSAEYGIIYGNTAVIEMAAASGLALLNEEEKNPLEATSRGTGELILRALDEGAEHIIIGIGGSATDDGGMGAASALGVKFLDAAGNTLYGCGADTEKIEKIDLSAVDPRLNKVDIKVICDVDNPLTGANGATYIYAPQKGADAEMLRTLETGMKNIERLYNAYAGYDICALPGSGAAGGMGAMLRTLMNAKLVQGAETVLEAVGFKRAIKDANLVITGEGMLDKTSAENGKAVGTVVRASKDTNVPIAVIAGCLGEGYESIYKIRDDVKVFAVSDKKVVLQDLKKNSEARFLAAAKKMLRSIINM